MSFLLRLYLIGVGLNIIWEFTHCWLYETCRQQTWARNVPLLVKMSCKDGFFIVLFYLIAAGLWQTQNILQTSAPLITFLALALGFSFADEKISVGSGRWKYAAIMPRIFNVGLTPLFEVAVTGVIALVITFKLVAI